MTKQSRKQKQKEIYEKQMAAKRQAMWNPDLPPEELAYFHATCERMFIAYERIARTASSLTKPAHDKPLGESHIGGSMLMKSPSDWPEKDGEPLESVIEVYLNELPSVPPLLEEYEVLQVFLELEEDDIPSYTGGIWDVRCLKSVEGYQVVERTSKVDPMPIAWELIETDTPNYPDTIEVIPEDIEDDFAELPNWSALLADKFPGSSPTKFGGWPNWIEGNGVNGTYCFSLDGVDVGIDMSMDGILIFGFNEEDSTWNCTWEIG